MGVTLNIEQFTKDFSLWIRSPAGEKAIKDALRRAKAISEKFRQADRLRIWTT